MSDLKQYEEMSDLQSIGKNSNILQVARDDLFNDLFDYRLNAANHKKHEKAYGKTNICITIPINLLFLFATFVGGLQIKGAQTYDGLSIFVLCCNAVGLIISTIATVFAFPAKVSAHHNSSGFFSDMAEDLQAFMVENHTIDEYHQMKTMMNEKEKIANAGAPNLGGLGFIKVLDELPPERKRKKRGDELFIQP